MADIKPSNAPAPQRATLWRHSRWVRFLLSAISVAVCLVLLEVGLHVREALVNRSHPQHPRTPRTNEWAFFEYDDVLGWRNRPGARGWFEIPDSSTYVRISSEGLRDLLHGRKTGRYRILVLGDSFVWGFGVEDEHRVTNRLQQRLGQSVEVINAGVSGWGTDQELLYLRKTGRLFEPDLVVLVLGLEDLENIHNSVEYTYPKPYFSIRGGALELCNVPVPKRNTAWTTRFGVQPQHRRAPTSAVTENPGALYQAHRFLRHHFYTYRFVSIRVARIVARRGWMANASADSLLKQILVAMRATCTQIGARLLLVPIPYNYHMAKTDDDRIKDAVLAAARDAGIEYLDLWPLFRSQAAAGRGLYFEIDPHWNATGHEVAAEALASHLENTGWLQASTDVNK
jgi:lysophospholipase L1-like esterase